MTHVLQLSDTAYQAFLMAAQARGQTLETYVEELARQQEHDPSQAWFWTPEWQAGERRADTEIAAGESEYFKSEDDFLNALETDANV